MANKLQRQRKYMQFINECELAMQAAPIDLPVKHYFTPGLYLREMFIPAGVMLTSKVHLTHHPYIVSQGEINIIDGEQIIKVLAPFTGENKAGTRRLGYAVTDVIWTAIFQNEDNCTDLSILEDRLFKIYENPLLSEFKEVEA